jgi:tetratricopeptide (TPR) repeat protein
MDCRRQLISAILAMGLGGFGCAHQQGMTLAQVREQTAADLQPEGGKRRPRASTCLAFGNFDEHTALDPARSPADKQQLLDQARKAYQQAIQLEPKNATAIIALARVYNLLDDHDRAIATYTKGLKSLPKEPMLWHELGMCHARHKEWDQALQALRKASELDPENRSYSHSLAFCLARCGRYDESLAVFTKVESEADAHYNLARMLHHLKRDELSKQHLRLALEIKPEMKPAEELLALLENPGAEKSNPIANVGFQTSEAATSESGNPAKDETAVPPEDRESTGPDGSEKE